MGRVYQNIMVTLVGILIVFMLCVMMHQIKTQKKLDIIVDFVQDIDTIEVLDYED